MKRSIFAGAALLATLAGTGWNTNAVLAGGGNELCEPARLSGKARPSGKDATAVRLHLAQQGEGMMRRHGMMGQGMMGQRRGHGPGMGMMRGHGMSMGRGMGGMMGNPVRHRYVMMGPGIPAAYANLKNPLPPTQDNIAAGRKLYAENCASCHGATGRGDGEAGRELDPKPANIAFTIGRPVATDGFLMWTISEGGRKLGTAMPAFRDALSEKQRWQLILFLREGLR